MDPILTAALILFAHGSYDAEWKQPFEQLRDALQESQANPVYLAYMEMTEPTLMDAAKLAINNGAKNITILPLFMASGGHMKKDVPQQCASLKEKHPSVTITILPPVGEHPLVTQAIQQIAEQAMP